MSDDECFHCIEHLPNCVCGNPTSYSDECPVCPYCGEKDTDTPEYVDGHIKHLCPHCDKQFTLDVFTIRTWTGTRLDD